MLAQLEVKEINSRTFKDFYWIFKDFPVLEYIFFQFKDFPGFSRPVYTLYIYINANMADSNDETKTYKQEIDLDVS